MSTFLGLLSAGKMPMRFEILSGLGADAEPKKKPGKKNTKTAKRGKLPPVQREEKKVVVRRKGGLRNQPLDNTHQPFKRSDVRPGGPKGVSTERTGIWECERVDPGNFPGNVQKCVGPKKRNGERRIKMVRVKKKYKTGYNKDYHKHLKSIGEPKFKNEKSYEYNKSTRGKKAGPAAKRKPRNKKKAAKK